MSKKYIEPGDTILIVVAHSEVCMDMKVAGKVMAVLILERRVAQLLNDDGSNYSSPITLGEAGLHQDADGIYGTAARLIKTFHMTAGEWARYLIRTQDEFVLDYCAERCQILGNVSHMAWLEEGVAEAHGGGWAWHELEVPAFDWTAPNGPHEDEGEALIDAALKENANAKE